MKKNIGYKAIMTASVLVIALAAHSSGNDKDGSIIVSGSISDSQCAFNVHSDSRSHDWMIKKGVYGANDDKSCTLRCVKEMGGKFVLVAKKEVYRLDDQTMPEKFAGAKVKVTGILEAKTHTIHIQKIEEDK
jgi:hypothetical protein